MVVAWLLFCLLSAAEIIRFGATGLDPRCQFKKRNSGKERKGKKKKKQNKKERKKEKKKLHPG
jgi:hypothetical protein